MKKRVSVALVATTAIVLLAAFATNAFAFQGLTSPCNGAGCHGGVNVPVVATLTSNVGGNATYSLSAPTATAMAVFNGATKVGTTISGTTGSFTVPVGSTYTIFAVRGPTTADGLGTTSVSPGAPPTTFLVTSSAGANGTITPLGAQTVASGASITFTITPAMGYSVASVLVDGVSAGAVTTYTFTNVTAAHTIAATFAVTGTLTPSTTTLSQSATTISWGSTVRLFGTATPSVTGNSVTVQYRRAASDPWVNLTTALVDSSGAYTRTISQMAMGTWYFRVTYSGSPTVAASNSGTAVVVVRRGSSTTLGTSASTIRWGAPVKLYGAVYPRASGQRVTVQYRRSTANAWRSLASATIDSTGRYQRGITRMAKGNWYFRVVYAGSSTYAGSISPTRKVVVR